MAAEVAKRRLAAILAADVVGYSRLMSADEAGTLARVKALRGELFDPATARHGGRIFKTMGDGVLVEFPSAVAAVQCAVEVQRALDAADGALKLRIGISLGDVIVDGDDLYGNGVNVAARLEAMAEEGGICVSGNVHEHVAGAVSARFDDWSEHEVKNIPRPVRVWRVDLSAVRPGEADPKRVLRAPPPDKPSIAVLPFTNMGGNPEQDYFADGITEDIITELARFQSIFVIARNSVFTYKGRAVQVQDVGRELGVRYVVEGSVRKAGNRVRVTVQLIDAATGNHVWAERYDREIADVFELQDELTSSIAATLPGRLASADLERVKRKPLRDIGAYDYLLRAKLLHHRGSPDDNAQAMQLLDRAVENDPEFAAAYGWRACTLGQAAARGYVPMTEEVENRVYGDMLKGLSIDDNDLECIRIQAEFRIEQRRLDEALMLNDKAMRLNPNDPRLHAQRGEVLTWLGRAEEGVECVRRAMRLDPYQADAWAHLLGRAEFGAGNYREALSAFKRIAKPRAWHHGWMAACHALLGETGPAAAERAECLRLDGDFKAGAFSEGLFYDAAEDREHIRNGMIEAGLPD